MMERNFMLENIHDVAREFWQTVGSARIFAFHGAMGSGKTTFIHALCELKEVKDAVTSPTFSIINEYAYQEEDPSGKTVTKTLFHLDLYRLNTGEEAIQAGVEDCLLSEKICLVEWPEKAESLLPQHTLHVFLELINDQTRRIKTDGI